MKNKNQLYWVLTSLTLAGIGMNIAHPATPTFIKSLGLGDYVFGLAYATMAFFNFSTSLTWGSLSSKYKISILLLIGAVVYGFSQFLFGTATSVLGIVMARGLAGISSSSFAILPINYLIVNSQQDQRLRNVTLASIVSAVSASVGYLVGGLIAEISILFVFVFQTFWMIGVGLIFYMVFNDHQSLPRQGLKLDDFNPFIVFSKAKKILYPYATKIFIIVFISWIAVTLFDSSFNYYIKDVFNFPPKINGYLKALIGVLSLFINSVLTMRLLARFDLIKVNRILYSLLLVSSQMVLWIIKPEAFITISFGYFMFASMVLPIQQNTISSLYKETQDSNLSIGLFNAVKMLGSVIGSLLAGFVYELKPIYPFGLSSLLFALVLVINLLLKNNTNND